MHAKIIMSDSAEQTPRMLSKAYALDAVPRDGDDFLIELYEVGDTIDCVVRRTDWVASFYGAIIPEVHIRPLREVLPESMLRLRQIGWR
jgi:hypothetical protein